MADFYDMRSNEYLGDIVMTECTTEVMQNMNLGDIIAYDWHKMIFEHDDGYKTTPNVYEFYLDLIEVMDEYETVKAEVLEAFPELEYSEIRYIETGLDPSDLYSYRHAIREIRELTAN